MTDNENKQLSDQRDRLFVVGDFSVRDIPFALLAYGIISAASVVLLPCPVPPVTSTA